MSFDERIDRLTERQEALAQSIELMIIENRERDAKWDKRFGQLTVTVDKVTSTVDKVTSIVERLADSIDKLSHIAALHQNRLDSHDDRLDALEGTA